MRISDWSSDVCSSDLQPSPARAVNRTHIRPSCRTQTEVRRQRLMMIRTAHEALLERKHPNLRFTLAVAEAEATPVGPHRHAQRGNLRSEERRVGKESVRQCTSRCSPKHSQNYKYNHITLTL